jgi:hypothetical protein
MTNTFTGFGEVIVDAVIAKLQAGWQARCDHINAQYADDLFITPPPGDGDYFKGRARDIFSIPSCFVLAGPATFQKQGPHALSSVYQINIFVVEQESTGPRVASKLLRQVRAVLECLYDDAPMEAAYIAGQSSVIGPYEIFPLRTIPGPVFRPEDQVDAWRGTTQIVFSCKQEEL